MMTERTGDGPAADRFETVHPLIVRVTHWVNALAMVIMILSGWGIYNDDPQLPFTFPNALSLGGDPATAHAAVGDTGLAGALLWHFAGMWLLVANGLVYVTYGVVSGHFRRSFFPIRPKALIGDFLDALRLRLGHTVGVYNTVQRSFYVGVLALAVLIVLTGLAIWKPVQFQTLTALFGGYDVARWIHLFSMFGIVAFLFVHLVLTALVPSTLPAMITGRMRRHEAAKSTSGGED